MRLTQKIALVVLVPLVAMTAFAGLAVAVALTDGQRAGRLSTLVGVAQRCAELARALQDERVAAVSRLVGPGPALTVRSEEYLAAVTATDSAVAALRATWGGRAVAEPAGSRLAALDSQLGLLESVRGQVAGGAVASSAVAFRYRIIIASTVDFREAVAQAGEAPADVADAIRAAVDLSRAGEALGLQQVAVVRAIDAGRLSRAAAAELTASRAGFTEAVGGFTAFAPPAWHGWWREATTGPEVLAVQTLQDAVTRVAPGETVGVEVTAWVAATRTRIGLVHDIEALADTAVLAWVEDLRAGAMRRAGLITAGVLAAATLAVGLAVRLGRPVVADLRRLRDGARSVAYERLPALVARMNQPRGWRDVHPDEVAASVPSTGVTGRHEVGEVAAAFDDVYRAAVRSAAELARSRLGVAQMHISLARRLQRRTSQLTARLDAAERDEQDPARLAFLFGLDHLVTLMRRTTEALLVLGGHGPGAVHPQPVPMYDVLRAAVGRIEDYARVRIGAIDPDLAVAGHAVDELVLLLAELMDNATVLSHETVAVHAQRLADRVVLQVIDVGIGIDERRRRILNDRLNAPVVDVDAVSRMGLTVVGLLASHHGMLVELRPNLPRGCIAEVVVPAALLRASVGMTPSLVEVGPVDGRHRARPQAIAAPRPRSATDNRVAGESTAELPVYTSLHPSAGIGPPGAGDWPDAFARTAGGLPVRAPQAHAFPDRPVDRGWTRRRDPRQVAAALSAYARGISQGRAQHRDTGPPTFPARQSRIDAEGRDHPT